MEHAVSSTELVAVRTFLNDADAEVALTALQAAGIEAMIKRDDCGGIHRELWMSGIDLVVRAEDARTADEILSSTAEVAVPSEMGAE